MGQVLPPLDEIDPRGLITDAYAIEGISMPECRSVFLDWAIGVPQGTEAAAWVPVLLEHFADQPHDHPMSEVLREGLGPQSAPTRKGGRKGRGV